MTATKKKPFRMSVFLFDDDDLLSALRETLTKHDPARSEQIALCLPPIEQYWPSEAEWDIQSLGQRLRDMAGRGLVKVHAKRAPAGGSPVNYWTLPA